MIPSTSSDLNNPLEFESQEGLGFKLNFKSNRIAGMIDDLESVKQAIFMILNTERYEYLIHSWDYGIELKDLYGEPVSYVCPEIERRVTEALLMDDRITDVNDFEFDYSEKNTVDVTFIVETLYGNIPEELKVTI